MKRSLKLIMTTLLTFSILIAVAQDPGDPSDVDPAAPIDGGISLLLAAGAALGGKTLFRKKIAGERSDGKPFLP
jgi:hypothetical protein